MAVFNVSCSHCDYRKEEPSVATHALMPDGTRRMWLDDSGRRHAEEASGQTWRELARDGRAWEDFLHICLDCGTMGHYPSGSTTAPRQRTRLRVPQSPLPEGGSIICPKCGGTRHFEIDWERNAVPTWVTTASIVTFLVGLALGSHGIFEMLALQGAAELVFATILIFVAFIGATISMVHADREWRMRPRPRCPECTSGRLFIHSVTTRAAPRTTEGSAAPVQMPPAPHGVLHRWETPWILR